MTNQNPPKKGVAYTVVLPILDADGDLVTAAAGLDSEISKDLGTFADCTNEATEIATSSGMYYLTLTATEMNADIIAIIVKTSTSGAKTTPIVIYTSGQTYDETDDKIDTLLTRLSAARTGYLDNINQAGLLQVTAARAGYLDKLVNILKVLANKWQITGNQLIIYDDDNLTPIYTFNLYDSAGDPAMENVYKRQAA